MKPLPPSNNTPSCIGFCVMLRLKQRVILVAAKVNTNFIETGFAQIWKRSSAAAACQT